MKLTLRLLLLAVLLLPSCQRYDFAGSEDKAEKVGVTFRIGKLENAEMLSTMFKRFSLAIFQNGVKVQVVNQTVDEEVFGSVSTSLVPGQYQVVAIAHSGQGNCTISSADKVTFHNNRLTDTFYYYGVVTVSDEGSTEQLVLKRAVSMFRLIVMDEIPEEVAKIQIAYTGGSSTFSPFTGFGSVNSRQTEEFWTPFVPTDGNYVFEVFTFPHSSADFIDVTVTAVNTEGVTIAEKKVDNIYIQPNVITQHRTRLFSSTVPSSLSFLIDEDGEWSDIVEQ